jgi:uncharacterized membrane protein YagU involved in acid resistance
MNARAVAAILWGGLIAGTLDLTYACVSWGLRGVSPVTIMQSIAAGVLGPASFEGGVGSATLGVLLHYFILIVAAALYYAASRKFDLLTRRAVGCGLLYGVAIYVVMNFVVLPLSASAYRPTLTLGSVALNLSVHMILVGLPIALMVRRSMR